MNATPAYAANRGVQGSLTGISIGVVTPMDKVWRSLQAFGDIAFAYSFSNILIEIQVSSNHNPLFCSTVLFSTTGFPCFSPSLL